MIASDLLCGGSGTRLWPLSRKSCPKQFAPLTGRASLFQTSALRLSGEGVKPSEVVTGADLRFIVTERLSDVGITAGAILIEPSSRNTTPAILAAALKIGGDALNLVAPSDHVIPDGTRFREAVQAAAAMTGQLVASVTSGARVPIARLRLLRRRTDRPSSR